MNIEGIKILIEAFYNGETSAAEEQELLHYFEGDNITEELVEEREIFLQLSKAHPIEVPVGLELKLNDLIDTLAENESVSIAPQKVKKLSTQQLWLRIGGVAASVAILFSIGLYIGSEERVGTPSELTQELQLKDSFEDPTEAYKEAEKALLLVSSNLNKGVNQISVISDHIDKTNTILDKNVNRINTKNL